MRFLMLNWRDPDNPQAGGAERVTLAFLRGLVERGHQVFWFANSFPESTRTSSVDGISIVRGGGKGSSVIEALRWYRSQDEFDLVIDQHHGIPWYAPWWCRTNCIAYIHEVLGPIWNSFYPWPMNWVGRWQEKMTHRFYRNVTFWTPADSTKRRLVANGVRHVKVLSNGIDTNLLETLDDKMLVPPVRLITVSRLAPNKRIDHAIRAVSLLNQRGCPTNLTVVGGGEAEAGLHQLADKLGLSDRIRFTGLISEQTKNEELRHAHLLVHTSVREGWGLNVTEANAMGTPAVVYPVDGLVDSTVHRHTGLITNSETPESMAESIAALVGSPREYVGLRCNAWERAKLFQWEHVLPPACEWLEAMARGD